MAKRLHDYFPMIRERDEVLQLIRNRSDLSDIFDRWEETQQKEFLDFCSGVKGVKMLYDSFAKELLNPETVPERLNELLSLLLDREVQIIQVLPNDGSRIADETSLLVMDIVVKMDDGSIANIEIQKIGYKFPGQRSACYSADLLLRQYKLIRSQKAKETFSYRDIKSVYTIVLFEKSTSEFHRFPDQYKHFFAQQSDTGLELDLLQKFLFIPLDIYRKKHHNKPITSRLDAWLMFFCSDEPEDIISLIEAYPDFKAMYEQIYYICRNIEGVMGMFSEELRILDRNTVRYMMDEMQSEIDQQKEALNQVSEQLSLKQEQLEKVNEQLSKKDEQLNEKDEQLNEKDEQLNEKDEQLSQKSKLLIQKEEDLQKAFARIAELEKKLRE